MVEYELLRDLVAKPSISGNEEAIAQYVAERCEEYGLAVTMVGGSVAAFAPGRDPTKAFVMNGHLDTVPIVEEWKTDPFVLTENADDPDMLFGLGASDAKAGIAVALNMAKRLGRDGADYDIYFLFSDREETDNQGGRDLAEWISQRASGRYRKIGGLILEPTNGGAFVSPGHRNGLLLEVSASGVGGHGSQLIPNGATAVEKLSRFVTVGLPLIRKDWEQTYSHELLGIPTLNPTNVRAGAGAHNIIPTNGSLTFDMRTTPALDEALPDVLGALEREYDVNVTSPWKADKAVCPDDAYIYQVVRKALPDIPFRAFPGSTDLPYFLEKGIPMLILGPGELEAVHKQDEWVRRSDIIKCSKMILTIMQQF